MLIHTSLSRATVCNGHTELCSRSYGNVTFLGSHDSFAFSKDPFARAALSFLLSAFMTKIAVARDQEVDIPSQLSLGVRLLQAQSHK